MLANGSKANPVSCPLEPTAVKEIEGPHLSSSNATRRDYPVHTDFVYDNLVWLTAPHAPFLRPMASEGGSLGDEGEALCARRHKQNSVYSRNSLSLLAPASFCPHERLPFA